jgi:putative aminopeptidase FrvX
MTMAIPGLLSDLLRAPGPSGQEARPAAIWRDWCRTFAAEVDVDHMGSSWARIPGTGPEPAHPSLAVVGHIDEIGVHITHITDEGFLRFGQVGGWDPINLVSQRVVIDTLAGPVHGVIGRKAIHLLTDEERKEVPKLKNLHIDIGASDGDEARSRVRIGDVGVVDAEPLELPNDLLVSRALDNRVGCYVAARAAQIVQQAGGSSGDFLAMAVVQEEVGLHGASTSAYRHKPDVAIAIDVIHATDSPGIELGETTKHVLGSGPVLERGTVIHPHVFELLYAAAEAEGIPYTIASSARGTGTDADAIYLNRAGIPTGLVSVPLRYMHSSVETVRLDDVENASKLVAAFAMRLQPDTKFVR